MKKLLRQRNNCGKIAVSQIMILVVAIFASAWMIGSLDSVSADGGTSTSTSTSKIINDCASTLGGECIDARDYNSDNSKYLSSSEIINGEDCKTSGGLPGIFEYGHCGQGNMNVCCVPSSKDTTLNKVATFVGIPTSGKELYEKALSYEMGKIKKEVLDENLVDEVIPSVKEDVKIPTKGLKWTTAVKGIVLTAATAYGFHYFFGKVAEWTNAGTDVTIGLKALGAGLGTYVGLTFFGKGILGKIASVLGVSNPVAALIVSGVVAVLVGIFSKEVKEAGVVYYYCNAWDAPTGGKNCEVCNNQEVPCSEYQCMSLGQSCEFVASDDENDGESFCFWNNRNDIDPPVIKPDTNALSEDYFYDSAEAISPPDTGVRIVSTENDDGCLSPYSTVTFGVTLDEPAKCKISFQNENSYEDMANYLGGTQTKRYNQTQTLLIPEIGSSLGKDNLIIAYVRCQDSNGNSNPYNFAFEMCLEEGPDTTAPLIKGTSILNGAKIPYGVTNASVDVYVNEPAECKWSFSDENYDDMDYNMTCNTDPTQINLLLGYTCNANLTGIRMGESVNYYFRCRDNPDLEELSDRNTNAGSYKYSLEGSRALSITSISPNATQVSDLTSPATVELKAKTIGGSDDGISTCLYSQSGADGSYTFFENTNANSHSTNLYLYSGDYDYYVSCYDEAGNAAVEKVNFTVYVDDEEPLISRAYYDEGDLKIITSEKSECVYSTFSCEYAFDDGVVIKSYDEINHYLDWNTDADLYIKCQDVYGNRPALANACSIVLRAQEEVN